MEFIISHSADFGIGLVGFIAGSLATLYLMSLCRGAGIAAPHPPERGTEEKGNEWEVGNAA